MAIPLRRRLQAPGAAGDATDARTLQETMAMDAGTFAAADSTNWAAQFAESLDGQRARVQKFLAAQRQRLQQAEAQLSAQLEVLAGELAGRRAETEQAKGDLEQRAEQVARQVQSLESLRAEYDARAAAWEQLQQRSAKQQEAFLAEVRGQQEELERRRAELAQRGQEIDATEAALRQEQRSLELKQAEHAAELGHLAALRGDLQARQAELEAQAARLAQQQAETEAQRGHIAREFKRQHAAHCKELERRREELKRRDTSERVELQQQLEAAGRRDAALQQQLEADRRREAEVTAERDALREECAQATAELARLAETKNCLAEAERQLAASAVAGSAGAEERDDFRRRYEMAMEDLRETKTQNAELQQQLAEARTAKPPAAPAPSGIVSWEAEKLRILAALESGSDEDEQETTGERRKVAELIEKTDQLVAEKDREIADLRHVLQNQACNLESVAVGAAALGEVLDNDAVIREERENLKRLQEQWREKLRQAEIDVSLQRAKIGRESAQLEERRRLFESQMPAAAEPGATAKVEKPVRGRWLARLGLKDLDEEAGPAAESKRR